MTRSKTKLLQRAVCMMLTVLLALFGIAAPLPRGGAIEAQAASVDYPAQLTLIATKDNSKVLTENGTTDNSTLSVKALGKDLSCSWRFDRVGSDSNGTFFKLTNAQSGRMLTPQNYSVKAGNAVVVYGAEAAKSQHWFVVPVKQDHLGNDLYYKIVNYEDTSLALTQGTSGMTLASYTGADSQLWLLNADGLQGFAGYCKNDGSGIKAADIGGLFGETVEVTTFDDLKKYAEADGAYTIIVKGDISGGTSYKIDGQNHYYNPDGRIYITDRKTIVGSYGKHTLYNVALCTKQNSGKGNNVIIRNLDIQHDKDANGNDNISVYFSAGQNLWVDHVTFTGHADYNKASSGQPDYDKFLACCYGADYCTISDCSFGLHEYGLILGYPDDTADVKAKYDGFPRMTLAANKFYQTLTRGPGLMRWGYFHSLCNYVDTFSMAYTVHSGCDIYAENCYYANGGNVICDWNQITYAGAYAESGSKFSNCSRTVQGQGTTSNPSYSVASTWRPTSHYDYVSISADAAKSYCSSYSGCQSANSNWMYLRFGSKGVPSAGFSEAPDASSQIVPASFNEGAAYRIKNVNSGLYLEVAGGAAENGTNIQQWGSDGSEIHNIWKLFSAGDGYYYLASCVGDGATYVLDIAGRKTANGTNADLYQYNGGTNQQFMLTQNADGSYKIRTRITDGASAVEIADASTASGANAQQWEVNGANCQDWILEAVTDPGTALDTGYVYIFENMNSGLVMDIAGGEMASGTNVQQWGANGFDCQKWILRPFGSGNYYYIRSLQDQSYVLKAEGSGNAANIDIVPYDSKDSAMLFRFTKNLDGSYSIVTHASKDAALVEVDGASKESGANVQQYGPTNSPCQKWNLQTETTTTTTTTTETTTTTTTAATTTTPAPTEPDPVRGDIVEDGRTDILDVIALLKYLHGMQGFSQTQFDAADLNEDGTVDVFDLALLKRAVLAK